MNSKEFYLKSERCKRISVDIDTHHMKDEHFKVLKVYFALRLLFPDANMSVKKTRRGFHVKAVDKSIISVPIAKRVDLRDALGDDPSRIDYERLKLQLGLKYWVDTLFKLKRYPDGTISMPEEINPVAFPWVSRLPAKKLAS